MKNNILLITVLLIAVFGYSQKQIKTIYTEIEDKTKWGNQKINKFITFNKSGSEIESGTWVYDKTKKIYITTKLKKGKENNVYNIDKQLLSSTTLIDKGPYKGLSETKTIYYYKTNGDLKRKVNYIAEIDTLDLGYEQFNQKIKISPEYIDHNFSKESEVFYENGKIKKSFNYLWGARGKLYTYDQKGNLLKIASHDFNNKEDALSLLKGIWAVKFTNKNLIKTVIIKYSYDTYGNWIVMEGYYSNNKLISKQTRTIEYF